MSKRASGDSNKSCRHSFCYLYMVFSLIFEQPLDFLRNAVEKSPWSVFISKSKRCCCRMVTASRALDGDRDKAHCKIPCAVRYSAPLSNTKSHSTPACRISGAAVPQARPVATKSRIPTRCAQLRHWRSDVLCGCRLPVKYRPNR